jgi:DNA-binding Lrp family transcriptional regulator
MTSPKLDRIDVNILVELQRNGRVTNADLADAVGLSPSPCLLRVKRLQQAGYITGYNARINLAKLGDTITVFVEVTLVEHRRENFVRFETTLQRFDEVVECHLISGGYDYLVKLVTPSLDVFQTIMETLLDSNAGISKYFSYIVVKSPIVKPEYPIRSLFADLA